MQLLMHKLIADEPIAVRFDSHKDARVFYEEMKAHYPDRVGSWSGAIYSARYEERGGVCYCPYFNEKGGTMTHGSVGTYRRHGVKIIEFSELLYDDSAEIEESVLPVEFLMN